MISVFICDDNIQQLKKITECVERLILIDELELKLELSVSDPGGIIEFLKNKKVDGLYFLDVELGGGQNGINVAQAIREYDPMGTIAFITSHPHYRELTFKYNVEAVDYIQKGDEAEVYKRLKACVNRALKKYAAKHEGMRYGFKLPKGADVFCRYEDILFFETDASVPHRIILHTKRMQYVYYHTLDKVFAQLPKNIFFKCFRSCIVNLNNLTESCKDELMQGKSSITMANGAECKVSAGNRKSLLKFMEIIAPPSVPSREKVK
ncbi:MAG: LytTR family DNA-binding domain-containing protein [Defluviitaleaceae bacterium]|nr:LytTR family DNA-binding domain-containing protein [Defluviitaleaceae bacterium]